MRTEARRSHCYVMSFLWKTLFFSRYPLFFRMNSYVKSVFLDVSAELRDFTKRDKGSDKFAIDPFSCDSY